MSEAEDKIRSHETRIEMDATPEQVWHALTDAQELVKWFPMEAKVEPGEGGSIWLSWGEAAAGTCHIKTWDPPHHLRTTWLEEFPGNPGEMIVDYFIEAGGAGSVLRLVHSGFRSGSRWDKEYDGTHRGWNQELRSLRAYLKRHRGKTRKMLWSQSPVNMPKDQAWERLMGAGGLVEDGSLTGLEEGARFSVRTATGDTLEGTVELNNPPTDFAAILENMGDSFFRIALEDCFGAPAAHIWLSTWDVPDHDRVALEGRLTGLLETLFPTEVTS